MSNSLDVDHAQRFVGPDLSPNCLQSLSAETLLGKEFFLWTTTSMAFIYCMHVLFTNTIC